MANWKDKIKAYALKNAVEHEGKAQEGSVISALFHEGLKKEDVKDVIKDVKSEVSRVNKLSIDEQKKEFEKKEDEISHRPEREGLPELPNAEKGVIMRFAPAASGLMHIGHAITGMPTSLYVKKYGGKFYLRIEDTNPENIDPRAYEEMPKEAEWIFGNVTDIVIQSDRLPIYYKYAEELIKKSAAYVCTCVPEKFKEFVAAKKECPCRKLSKEENMKRWEKMLDKKGYKEEEAVLRFKSDMTHPNPAMRDFPLARISLGKHPRQGTKYRVWPLMNLSVCADDIETGMTYIIRAKEHEDNARRQEMIFKVLGKPFPWTVFLGRYKFTDLAISKTKTKKLIKEGKFSGWDDIRLPFLNVLKRRGYQPGAFAKFAEQRGLSGVDKVISQKDFFQILDNFNRDIIKDISKKMDFSLEKEKGKGKALDKVTILMPDNTKKEIFTSLAKLKEGDMVYFTNLGYARLDDKKKKVFWFCHN